MEKDLTKKDLINMGLNTDILNLKELYTNQEAKEILFNEEQIMYTTENHLPEYKGNRIIPKYKKNIISK